MGADIHTMLEVNWDEYDTKGNHVWSLAQEHVFDNPYFSMDREIDSYNMPYHGQPFRERNYHLFSVIADVRNRDGVPIYYPTMGRGVPEDASPEWKRYVERWGVDLHSVTWMTVLELRELRHWINDQEGDPTDQWGWKARVIDAIDKAFIGFDRFPALRDDPSRGRIMIGFDN